MKITFGSGVWIEDLRFDDEHKTALIAHVGKFRKCTNRPKRDVQMDVASPSSMTFIATCLY